MQSHQIRYSAMGELIRMRTTLEDKVQIKAAARKAGLNTSSFIRNMLINQGVITP